MRKKVLFLLFFLFIALTACSNNNEPSHSIVFGERKGESELEARNVFEQGEQVNFFIEGEESFGVETLDVHLNIMTPEEEWEHIAKNELPVNPESNQLLNGLEGSLFEQLGPGIYQLEVDIGEETVSGDFVIRDKEEE